MGGDCSTGSRTVPTAPRAPLRKPQTAMGMDWADWHGTKEAIPPAYTQHIGDQLLDHITVPLGLEAQ